MRDLKSNNKFVVQMKDICIFLVAVYFFVTPFEDLLTGSMGTVAKYIAILIVVLGICNKRGALVFQKSTENVCIMILMFISIISVAWSIDRSTTVSRLVAYLLLPSIVLFVNSIDFLENDYELLKQMMILGGAATVLYLLLSGKLLESDLRLEITSESDPNNFAAQLFLPFACAFSMIFNKKKKGRNFYIIITGLLLFTIFLTGSRGGLLAVLSFFVTYFLSYKAYKKIPFLIGFVGLAIIFIYGVIPMLPEDIVWRLFDMQSYLGSEMSHNSRSSIWRIIIKEIIPSMSILGVGAGCVPISLSLYYGVLKGAHNTYLNMIVEYGILGIPVFLFFLAYLARRLIKEKKSMELSLLVGIAIIIFFLDSYPKKYFWNTIMLIVISLNARGKNGLEIKEKTLLHSN